MRRMPAGLMLPILALSLAGLVACSGEGSGGNGGSGSPGGADYEVSVTVEPATASVSAATKDLTVVFTITNEGTKADTYDLEAGDEFFGKKVIDDAVPADVSLQPGASRVLTLPLNISGSGTINVDFDVSITATSQANSAVSDQAACKVTVS